MKPRNSELPWRSVHFIGVGGVGMYGLATILLDLGIQVSGSDAARSDNLERLLARSARIMVGHCPENLGHPDAAVYSSAIPEDNPELRQARESGLTCYRRGQFLALLAEYFETVVAIAGSHGKTTTAAMLAHIAKSAGRHPGYLIGGDVAGWNSPASAGCGRRLLITEVDESDATQALIHCAIGLVVNIEDDHCWSVGGEQALAACFVRFAEQAERVAAWSTGQTRSLLGSHPAIDFLTAADLPDRLRQQLVGEHNLIDAALAIAAAKLLGVSEAQAVEALARFPGVQRRMSVRLCTPDRQSVIIEDYAHHPTELAATMQAVRQAWPEHRLTVVFQPHRFERIKRYAAAFRECLGQADAAVVFRPFAAWVEDGGLADPAGLIRGLEDLPARYCDGDFEQLTQATLEIGELNQVGHPSLFLVAGAGDVGQLVPHLRDRLARLYLHRLHSALQHALPELTVDCTQTWRELTTLGLGQARPLLAKPKSEEQLRELLLWLAQNRVAGRVLGNGSNLIGSDRVDTDLWISLRQGAFAELEIGEARAACGAGIRLPELVGQLLKAGRLPAALAPLGWIPGSLGGAVRMNAGADGACLGDFVLQVCGFCANGEPFGKAADALGWQYREVDLPEDAVVTRVELDLASPATPEAAAAAYRQAGERRRIRQPAEPSAGCGFRNPGATSAGRLLERCGLKGRQVGGCAISRQHANFIVRREPAGEDDFVELFKQVMRRVFRKTGIRLRPEVRFVNHATAGQVEQAVAPLDLTVLAGGPSREREISRRSGEAVAEALRAAGHRVVTSCFDGHELPPIPTGTDVVFPALHGTFGEDGEIQRRLEARGLPYVGSGPAASRTMIDKAATKRLIDRAGIPTPAWWLLPQPVGAPPKGAQFPLVVKPNREGSSFGVALVERPGADWERALAQACAYSDCVLVEEYVGGIEITVGVLFGRPLPVVEIIPPHGHWFDFDAKYEYTQGATEYRCPPASISVPVQERARELAALAWHELGAKDMARFDFIVDPDGVPWFLEANSIPGFTATSLLPKAAQTAGIGFVELCAGLIAANLPGWFGEIKAPES